MQVKFVDTNNSLLILVLASSVLLFRMWVNAKWSTVQSKFTLASILTA